MTSIEHDERSVRDGIAAVRSAGESGAAAARRAVEVGRRYRAARAARLAAGGEPVRAAVAGWNLGSNAAGRAKILVDLYATFAEVELLGFLFPWSRARLWEPLATATWPPVHAIAVDAPDRLPGRLIDLVLDHPCDILHLSKPRMPNVLLGLAYRAIWGATVLVDVDDEELAFVNAERPAELEGPLAAERAAGLPPLVGLALDEWTRISVAMAGEFDGVTVVNEPLRARYGGTIVRHAREAPPPESLAAAREDERARLGIEPGRVVVLFLGTPRKHKGLVETAEVIARAGRPEVTFLVVGDVPDGPDDSVKRELEAMAESGLDLKRLGNQPLERLPALVAAADVHVSLLDPEAAVSAFQTPAKLTDALAGGLAVIGRPAPGTKDILDAVGGTAATVDELAGLLAEIVRNPTLRRQRGRMGRAWFERHLALAPNARTLRDHALAALARGPGTFRPEIAPGLDELLGRLLRGPSGGTDWIGR